MGRLKGSTNINSSSTPITFTLKPTERIEYLANLIIDQIIKDQNHGTPLLNKLSIPEI